MQLAQAYTAMKDSEQAAVQRKLAYLQTIYQKDATKLKQFTENNEEALEDFPEVHYRKTSDGRVYDDCSNMFSEDTMHRVLSFLELPKYDVETHTDLLHVVGPSVGIFPRVYTPADNLLSRPEELRGQVCWMFPTNGTNFKAGPLIPQQWHWGNFIKSVMTDHPRKPIETHIILVTPLSVRTSDVQLAYALDRRLLLFGVRKWVERVAVVTDPTYVKYLNGDPTQLVVDDAVDNDAIMVISIKSGVSYQNIQVQHVGGSVQHVGGPNFPPPTAHAVHVRMDAPLEVAASVMDVIKLMNGYPTDTPSTVLQHVDTPKKFPLDHLPALLRYGLPASHAVADFFASPEEWALLKEGQEGYREMGLAVGLVYTEGAVLIAHMAGPGKKRKESPDVRTSLEILPHVCKAFASLVLWSKYDVLGTLHDGVDAKSLAGDVWDHDRLTVTDLRSNQRLFGESNTVRAPRLLMKHHVVVPQSALALYASQFGAVSALLPGQRTGITIIVFEHAESAYVAAGTKVSVEGVGSIRFTTGDRKRDLQYAETLPPGTTDSLEARCKYGGQFQHLTAVSLMAQGSGGQGSTSSTTVMFNNVAAPTEMDT